MAKTWNAYVINLETAPERWEHMQAEFKDTPLNLIRFTCQKSTSGRGWAEVGKTYADIMRKHMETDPEFKQLCVVFEDDAFRLQDKPTFSKRITDIFTYLETHVGTYSHFQGGGVYPIPASIESKEPLLIRCEYITCTTFTVFGKEAADAVLQYEKEIDSVQTPIDNYIGNKNRGKILAPFPHLVWQIIGLPSNISSGDQKVTLNEAFRSSHKVLSDFVKSKDISVMTGGNRSRKKKGKTFSFLQSAMKKFKRVMKKSMRHKVFLRRTRKSYQSAKAV
uniref:Glycosyltransferase n=1 Tax=viral metagenome TaxID=1070528 RepID=A0A6C0D7X6_9ZZZZ